MSPAWVGPLRTGTSGLGESAAFNPRGWRTGPGGVCRLPDCVLRGLRTDVRRADWLNADCPLYPFSVFMGVGRSLHRILDRRQIANARGAFPFCARDPETLLCAAFVAACSRTAACSRAAACC